MEELVKVKEEKKAEESRKLWEFECNAGLLRGMINKIIKINNEITLTVTKENISTIVVDPSFVILVKIEIPRKDFYTGNTCVNQEIHYKISKNTQFRFDLDKLDRVLRLTDRTDHIKGWIENNYLHIKTDDFYKKIKLLDTEQIPKMPELELDTKAEVKINGLARLKKAIETEDAVKLTVQDGLKAIIEDDDDKLTINLCKKEDVTGTGKAIYSSDYLNILLNSFGGSWYETVTIEFGTDMPVKVEGKAGATGNCTYILAPRIESDERIRR